MPMLWDKYTLPGVCVSVCVKHIHCTRGVSKSSWNQPDLNFDMWLLRHLYMVTVQSRTLLSLLLPVQVSSSFNSGWFQELFDTPLINCFNCKYERTFSLLEMMPCLWSSDRTLSVANRLEILFYHLSTV